MIVKLLTEHRLEFLSLKEAAQARLSIHLSKCYIENHMRWLKLIFRLTHLSRMDMLTETICNLGGGGRGLGGIFFSDVNRTFCKQTVETLTDAAFCFVWSGSALFAHVPQN